MIFALRRLIHGGGEGNGWRGQAVETVQLAHVAVRSALPGKRVSAISGKIALGYFAKDNGRTARLGPIRKKRLA